MDQMVKIYSSATEIIEKTLTLNQLDTINTPNRQNKRAIKYCPMQSSNYDCNNHITKGNNAYKLLSSRTSRMSKRPLRLPFSHNAERTAPFANVMRLDAL